MPRTIVCQLAQPEGGVRALCACWNVDIERGEIRMLAFVVGGDGIPVQAVVRGVFQHDVLPLIGVVAWCGTVGDLQLESEFATSGRVEAIGLRIPLARSIEVERHAIVTAADGTGCTALNGRPSASRSTIEKVH